MMKLLLISLFFSTSSASAGVFSFCKKIVDTLFSTTPTLEQQIMTEARTMLQPFNFKKWISDNRELLKPPVGNKCLYSDGTFIVMVVGGPNRRTDFHVNQSDEFFYQLEGDIFLRIVDESDPNQKIKEIPIREGEVFMLPAGVPHSPQRSENSVGLVVEKTREPGERDGLRWHCANCHEKLYEEFFHLENIETQFPPVFQRYYDSGHTRCKNCGHVNGKEWNP